jgi:hypothetical protein
MRGIYAGARSVLAAIKPTGAGTESIIPLLTLIDPTLGLEDQDTTVCNLVEDEATLSAFRAFCDDSYWNRIWIVQEFAISHALDLLVANSIVSAGKMETVLALFMREPLAQRWHSTNVLFNIRKSWQMNKPMPFLDILYETRSSLCGKRHDRVIGLMGLVLDGLELVAEPSYEVELSGLSTSMTQRYIERHSLDIIPLMPTIN